MLPRKYATTVVLLFIFMLSIFGVALAATGVKKITGPYHEPGKGYKFTVCANSLMNESVCVQHNTSNVNYSTNQVFGPAALPTDIEINCTNTYQTCQSALNQQDLIGTIWSCTIATPEVNSDINYAFYVVAGSSCTSGYYGIHSDNYSFSSGTTVVDLVEFTAGSNSALIATLSLSLLAAGAGMSLILLLRPKKYS